jgi:hypothetical protein
MKNSMIVTIVLLIVVAGVAFYGGITYQKSQIRSGFGQFAQTEAGNGNRMMQRNGASGNFGGATIGEILTTDANSITIKLQDGSSKIVNLSSSTNYTKSDSGSKADLKTGERVAAFGTSNSDGSITAQTVQINPTVRARPSTTPNQ